MESCYEWRRKNKKPADDTAGSKKKELSWVPLVFVSGGALKPYRSASFPAILIG